MEGIEATVLSEILLNENKKYYIESLKEEYFDKYKSYFKKMYLLYKENKLNTFEMINYDASVTCEIQDKTLMGVTLEYCIKQLQEHYMKQVLTDKLTNSIKSLSNNKDTMDVISDLMQLSNDLIIDDKPKNQDQVIYDYTEYIQERIKKQNVYYTGIRVLDNMLGGINQR